MIWQPPGNTVTVAHRTSTLKIWSQKVWAKIKKYWKLILIIMSAIVSALLFKKRGDYFRELIKENNATHDAELAAIEEARENERLALEEARKKHEETIARVEKEFELRGEELSDKKRKALKTLIDKHGDDPETMTRMIAEALGVDVFSPGETDDDTP